MNKLIETVADAIAVAKNKVAQYKEDRENAIKHLCHTDAMIRKAQSNLYQLESDMKQLNKDRSELHSLKFGTQRCDIDGSAKTTGPGNCNAAQAAGRCPVFHEQNDAVDTH